MPSFGCEIRIVRSRICAPRDVESVLLRGPDRRCLGGRSAFLGMPTRCCLGRPICLSRGAESVLFGAADLPFAGCRIGVAWGGRSALLGVPNRCCLGRPISPSRGAESVLVGAADLPSLGAESAFLRVPDQRSAGWPICLLEVAESAFLRVPNRRSLGRPICFLGVPNRAFLGRPNRCSPGVESARCRGAEFTHLGGPKPRARAREPAPVRRLNRRARDADLARFGGLLPCGLDAAAGVCGGPLAAVPDLG